MFYLKSPKLTQIHFYVQYDRGVHVRGLFGSRLFVLSALIVNIGSLPEISSSVIIKKCFFAQN